VLNTSTDTLWSDSQKPLILCVSVPLCFKKARNPPVYPGVAAPASTSLTTCSMAMYSCSVFFADR